MWLYVALAEAPAPDSIANQSANRTDSEEPFAQVDTMPTFQGSGLNEFRKWVEWRLPRLSPIGYDHLKAVFVVQFIIEKDGTLKECEMAQVHDRLLLEEVLKVVKTSPKWEPGMQDGVPVRVKYFMPVQFKLENSKPQQK